MSEDEKVKTLFDGAMSLYNTIDIETNNKENNYTTAEDKIKEVLNGEEPLYVKEDELAGMLFQYLNLGYAVTGIKYLDMLFNNKSIAATAVGYALSTLNDNTEKLLKYQQLYGELPDTENKVVEEKELKGISE